MIINHLHPKTHETTGNKPETQPATATTVAHPENQTIPNTEPTTTVPKTHTENTAFQHMQPPTFTPVPENEIPLIINDLDPKTHEMTGNKPEKPETPTPPLSDTPPTPPSPPKDNLIRQGEVFSRPVFITPSWPFREDRPGNKFRY